jgi:predicted 3-demethylubiquinone-9 3-methyltransferase (glyoxalase superfamily)
MQNLSTCLWFDTQALDAAKFYVGVFPNSRIVDTTYYLEGAPAPAGTVLTVQFLLDGTEYLALNGGPVFKFTPAISMVAYIDTQREIDLIWERLCEGGQPGNCGWLTDRYGVSWQIVPRPMLEMLRAADKQAAQRAFSAMMKMTKLDLPTLRRAFEGR